MGKTIIRCKDCSKRGNPEKCPKCIDAFFYIKDSTKDNDYCSDAVLKKKRSKA